jgi:hypothetical protein
VRANTDLETVRMGVDVVHQLAVDFAAGQHERHRQGQNFIGARGAPDSAAVLRELEDEAFGDRGGEDGVVECGDGFGVRGEDVVVDD